MYHNQLNHGVLLHAFADFSSLRLRRIARNDNGYHKVIMRDSSKMSRKQKQMILPAFASASAFFNIFTTNHIDGHLGDSDHRP
jgi:hypothetical protein